MAVPLLVIFALPFDLLPVSMTGPGVAKAQDQRSLTAPATDEEISSLIVQLGDSSYPRRLFATRRLCAIGVRATKSLRRAVQSDRPEVVIRARDILSQIDALYFADVKVELRLSLSRAGWEEPVDLVLVITNDSTHPARLPFDLAQALGSQADTDPVQVANLLDAADWLEIRRRGGKNIDPRIDDMMQDREVAAVVRQRISDAPVSILKAGEKVELVIRRFNRGWARYPLLDEGTYEIVFKYDPFWRDLQLRRVHAGRVRSNLVTLDITDSAPEAVSRGALEASARIIVKGGVVRGEIINRYDRPQLLNAQISRALPSAQASWLLETRDRSITIPVEPSRDERAAGSPLFKLVEVPPGGSIEVARTSTALLKKRLAELNRGSVAGFWEVRFTYVNALNRAWQDLQRLALQENEKLPESLRKPLPPRIITGRHSSEYVDMTFIKK